MSLTIYTESFKSKLFSKRSQKRKFVHSELEQTQQDLSRAIGGNFSELQDFISHLRKITKELKVEESALVHYASLYEGILKDELNKARAEAQFEKEIKKENPKKAEQIHQSIKQFVGKILSQVKNAEKWVKALEVTFKEAQQLIEKLPDEHKEVLTNPGMELLLEYGFPVDEFPEYAKIMAQYPTQLQTLFDTRKKKGWLEYGIPAFFRFASVELVGKVPKEKIVMGLFNLLVFRFEISADIITMLVPKEETRTPFHGDGWLVLYLKEGVASWEELVEYVTEIAKKVGDFDFNFAYFISAPYSLLVNKQITLVQVTRDLPYLVKSVGNGGEFVVRYVLPGIAPAFTAKIITWKNVMRDFPKMAHQVGKRSKTLFSSVNYGLRTVKRGILTWEELVETLPFFVKESYNKKNVKQLIGGLYGFRELIKERRITLQEAIESLIKLDKDCKDNLHLVIEYGLPAVQSMITSKTLPKFTKSLPKMVRVAGKHAELVFERGIPVVQDIIGTELSWDDVAEGLPKMAHAASDASVNHIFYGLKKALKGIITKETWLIIIKKLPKIGDYCQGAERKTFEALGSLNSLFHKFGIELLDLLVFPTLRSQKVASFLCFQSYGKIAEAIQTKEDIDILIKITNKRKFKANDFFEHILVNGIAEHIIAIPLSREKEYLIPFLENSTVDLIEVYREYKDIMASEHPEKHLHLKKMFKDLKGIKKDIFNGVLTKDYNPKILTGILYSVFGPELTVPRGNYEKTYNDRTDRQADIPKVLQKMSPETIKISRGGYTLKSGEELDDKAWRNLVEVVSEVNSLPKSTIIPELLGLELLEAFITKKLQKQQKAFLKKIYTFSVQVGEGLPEFNTEHSTLMKYKEFVGDRLRNDFITTLLDAAYTKRKEEFAQLMQRVKKPKKFDGLAKTLFGLWMSNKVDKEARMKSILERNNILAERLDWQVSKWQDIRDWLKAHSAGTMSKKIINDIFAMLMGEDYNQMQHEMDKFEHSHKASGRGGEKYIFMLSKRHPHCVAMYNMGVCIAPDDKLWNMPDFWQLVIFDKDFNAHGGVIYRTIEEGRKKYLILSIQPASTILSEVSPVHLYDNIVKFSEKMREKLHYDSVLIPTRSAIHSNRGSIQAIIKERNYPTKKLLKKYEFSYSPFHYSYQKFFIVG